MRAMVMGDVGGGGGGAGRGGCGGPRRGRWGGGSLWRVGRCGNTAHGGGAVGGLWRELEAGEDAICSHATRWMMGMMVDGLEILLELELVSELGYWRGGRG